MRTLLFCLLCSCAGGYYSGSFSLERAEKGEIFLDTITLQNKQAMIRVTAVIDDTTADVDPLLRDWANGERIVTTAAQRLAWLLDGWDRLPKKALLACPPSPRPGTRPCRRGRTC